MRANRSRIQHGILILTCWANLAVLGGELVPEAGVPAFRGDGSGVFRQTNPPTQWNEKMNVRWVAEIGDESFASPVVANSTAFVLCEPNVLFAVRLNDGRVLWKQALEATAIPEIDKEKIRDEIGESGLAAATPTTDGAHVYVVLGNGLVAAYKLDGHRVWARFIDHPMMLDHGRSASPVLAAGKLVVSLGWTMALDPADGKTIWENKKATSTYASPVPFRVGDKELILAPAGLVLDAQDGKTVAEGLPQATNTTPLVQNGVVYYVEDACAAYKAPDEFSTTMKFEKLWDETTLEGEIIASPLLLDGLLYSVSSDGQYRVLDAKTGKVMLDQATDLSAEPGEEISVYGSPILAGAHLYLSNTAGVTVVLKPGKTFVQVSKNTMDYGSGASLVCVKNMMLLRNDNCLYGIERKSEANPKEAVRDRK